MKDVDSTCVALRAASTEAQVVTILREYLSSLGTETVAYVPATVLSLGINHAKEIAQAAVEVGIREAQAAVDAPEAALLKDVGTVLSTAAMRLVVLACGADAQTASS
ncbi:MAG TPA: hypothetical protein VN598_02175 [Usitatibacter sp.]|nr:hypothetical protein [Usitatibacter sp.]